MPRPRACLHSRAQVSALLAAMLLITACGDGAETSNAAPAVAAGAEVAAAEHTVTVHRTATCSCCGDYEAYLEASGFTVEQKIHDELTEVKDHFGIPESEGSCHTNEVGGYAAEGHVPAEALLELLDEQPPVDGISLAGMPAGSPGMPGEKEAPFVLHTFLDGEVTGELGRF